MTVKYLIDLLKTFPPDAKVYLASDEEGNSFHHVAFAQHEFFEDNGGRELEVLASEDAEEDTPKAVVLWP